MGPFRNDAQRRFARILTAALVVKIVAFLAFLALLLLILGGR